MLAFDGRMIAAVDLLAHCGLGRLRQTSELQGLVITLEAGDVALLVERVVDITPLRQEQLCPLPGRVVGGDHPCTAVVQAADLGPLSGGKDHLLIDAGALRRSAALAGLASAHTPVAGPGPAADRKSTRLNSSHSQQSRMPSSA